MAAMAIAALRSCSKMPDGMSVRIVCNAFGAARGLKFPGNTNPDAVSGLMMVPVSGLDLNTAITCGATTSLNPKHMMDGKFAS
jgi:hypothetical protein